MSGRKVSAARIETIARPWAATGKPSRRPFVVRVDGVYLERADARSGM